MRIKYQTIGKEKDGFVVKGIFNTMDEAIELANWLNSKQDIFYYDWREIKTEEIKIESYKDSSGWTDLAHTLLFDSFKNKHHDLDEDEVMDLFYTNIVSKMFQYGEFATLTIEVDENFNVIGGKIHKHE